MNPTFSFSRCTISLILWKNCSYLIVESNKNIVYQRTIKITVPEILMCSNKYDKGDVLVKDI